jgi:hypothetical protein
LGDPVPGDPGGFEDLARALTVAYTPYHADDALRRAAWLLNERLTGLTAEEFRGWGLAEEIGTVGYRAATDRLWQQLTWYEFDVTVPPLSHWHGRWQYAPGEARSLRRVVARHFSTTASASLTLARTASWSPACNGPPCAWATRFDPCP